MTLPRGTAAFKDFVRKYRDGAVRRGLAWDLTDEQVHSLCSLPCYYCAAEPRHTVPRKRQANGDYRASGLDRVDNKRGYFPDNVVPCCSRCNFAKRSQSSDEFTAWLNDIAYHRGAS